MEEPENSDTDPDSEYYDTDPNDKFEEIRNTALKKLVTQLLGLNARLPFNNVEWDVIELDHMTTGNITNIIEKLKQATLNLQVPTIHDRKFSLKMLIYHIHFELLRIEFTKQETSKHTTTYL